MPRLVSRVETVVTGSAAVLGLVVSGAVLAVAVAGLLQWGPHVPALLDDGIPLVVLAAGMLLGGRVAVDVAGRGGLVSCLLAAVTVAVLGDAVSRASEAHGDGIELQQVLLAGLVVLVLTSGSALLVLRLRRP